VALARHVLRAAGIAKLKGGSASLERVAADACFATYEYDCAMALSRRSLQRDPTDRAAFWLASEITAQRRLGVLRFSGREYLDGFAELEPAERWLEPAALSAAVSRMRAQSPLQALHERLGDEYFRSRDWRESLRHFSLAEAAEPGGFSSGFKLAWMLGAIPDSALRDGPRALQLAQGYGERTGWRTASAFDLLGVALAEAGDWEGAIAAAGGALERLTAASDADGIRERLEGYRARRPHRLRSRASLP
jgi:tetratricopeptide (TPR) repeat protein